MITGFGARGKPGSSSEAPQNLPASDTTRRRPWMLRRTWYALLLTAFALSFVACGGKEDDEEEAPAKSAAATSPSAAPAAPAGVPAAGAATVTGKVAFTGGAPQMEQLKMDADAFCKAAHQAPVYAQEVEVNGNGTLKDVLVFVKSGVTGTYTAPAEAVTLDQRG